MSRDTRFVFMHINYPFYEDLIAAGETLHERYVDMCWSWIISPVASVNFLKQYLVTAPANKVLTFGGDYVAVEPVVGHVALARQGIALALSKLVEEGWLTLDSAVTLVESIMRGNARDLFHLEEKTRRLQKVPLALIKRAGSTWNDKARTDNESIPTGSSWKHRRRLRPPCSLCRGVDSKPGPVRACTSNFVPLPLKGNASLNDFARAGLSEHVADYVVTYDDGTELRCKIQRRHHIGMFRRRWGENCFRAVPHNNPIPTNANQDNAGWGYAQQRVNPGDVNAWLNWLWAWQNPHPNKAIVSLRFEPKAGTLILSAISAGRASSLPLRWQTRQKALLKLPPGRPSITR